MQEKCIVVFVLIIFSFGFCADRRMGVRTKFKRKVDSASDIRQNMVKPSVNSSNVGQRRGLFSQGSIFSLGKVLNFFPVGGERECQPEGYSIAKAGICLNPYDCKQREGRAAGECAHGLGVCCIFEISCGGMVQNNLTYFMSPGFPELWTGDEQQDCNITIDKTHAGIMQLRVDFVHFVIGQPNRLTGECDEDAMTLGEGNNTFVICGQNHGQHIYYTLSSGSESREAGDLPRTKSTPLSIRMRGSDMPRLWLLRLAQMPLAHCAPHDCLQYFTEPNGTIKTFNYAVNGRHLARQEYRACVRKNVGYCAVQYSPCDSRSFRIGIGDGMPIIDPADIPPENELMPVDEQPIMDEEEGSGAGMDMMIDSGAQTRRPPFTFIQMTMPTKGKTPMQTSRPQTKKQPKPNPKIKPLKEKPIKNPDPGLKMKIGIHPSKKPQKGFFATIWSYIWPSWMWGQRHGRADRSFWNRWNPYSQHYTEDRVQNIDKFRYYGYGNFGVGLEGFGRQRCKDRITIPCENEYFVSSSYYGAGVCDPHHCGNTFCPGQQSSQQCHVETSIAPFAVSVHFGPPMIKRNPEENIGACLKYTQLPCDV